MKVLSISQIHSTSTSLDATVSPAAGQVRYVALSLDDRERAFRELYAAHFDAVLGFALRRVDRPEDAGDVTADTFLVA